MLTYKEFKTKALQDPTVRAECEQMNKYAIPDLDIEALAKALEFDLGEELPDIQQALTEAKNGTVGRITTPEQLLVRQARTRAGLTQQAFADRIATPVATLRDWEQGRFVPPGGSCVCFG